MEGKSEISPAQTVLNTKCETPRKIIDLCNRLGIPEKCVDSESVFFLEYSENRLWLKHTTDGGTKVCADFIHGRDAYRAHSAKSGLPLARACGVSSKKNLHIIDATAGLCRDSIALLGLGCRITAVERSPVVYALIRDAHDRALEKNLKKFLQMKILCADSCEFLKFSNTKADVIYIDPMYPPRKKKSALPKKDMAFLRGLLGEDIDRKKLLEYALASTAEKVVVKLPPEAKPVLPSPSHSIGSKLVRYDIYRT